jgi:hypothetical protein
MAKGIGINTVHLQGLGPATAKPAKDFAVGEYTMWNYGALEVILHIAPKGTSRLTWRIMTESGREYDRVVKTTRLVAIGHRSNFPERLREHLKQVQAI